MGYEKVKRPLLAEGGVKVGTTGEVINTAVQSLTGASTATQLTNYGVTKIVVASGTESATAGTYTYEIANPVVGSQKTILVDNATTRLIQVRTETSTTGSYLLGTTHNAVQFTTGSTAYAAHVELIGLTTAQWAVKNISTRAAVTVAATAG